MPSERLDISPFSKAIARLEEGLERYEQNTADDQIRDGLVQRFEFTYELSHKMLKRHLKMTSPSPDIYESMNFQDIIRTGNVQGLLLGEWIDWKLYREKRAKTSHTYDEEVALDVAAIIPQFLREACFLSDKLIERGHE